MCVWSLDLAGLCSERPEWSAHLMSFRWGMTGPVRLFGIFFQQSRSCSLAAILNFLPTETSSIPPCAFATQQVLSEPLHFLMNRPPRQGLLGSLTSCAECRELKCSCSIYPPCCLLPHSHFCVTFVLVSNCRLGFLQGHTDYSSLWLARQASTSQCHSSNVSKVSFFLSSCHLSPPPPRLEHRLRIGIIKSRHGVSFLISLSPFPYCPSDQKKWASRIFFLCVYAQPGTE